MEQRNSEVNRPRSVYLLRSHTWLHDKLTAKAQLPTSVVWAHSPEEADVVIWPEPPWPDEAAPDRLAALSIRTLKRLFAFSQEDLPLLWAPGVYTSAPVQEAADPRTGLAGGFYIAHHHHEAPGFAEALDAACSEQPDLLWSFIGSVSNHRPVRSRIAGLDDDRALAADTEQWRRELRWDWTSDDGRGALDSYLRTLARSMFVVCPRGVGPSSIRLFEAMRAGRCPVIVSDEWAPPPFVNWDACSIRVPEREIEALPSLLRARENEAAALGRAARVEWEAHFSDRSALASIVRACLLLEERMSGAARRRRARLLARAAVSRPIIRYSRTRIMRRR